MLSQMLTTCTKLQSETKWATNVASWNPGGVFLSLSALLSPHLQLLSGSMKPHVECEKHKETKSQMHDFVWIFQARDTVSL